MVIALLFLFLFLINQPILASTNIFGLHLTQTPDIYSAKDIINSSGGDWGWVTIVIRTDQLNLQNWQEFFDNCRRYHLIPILRLATVMENNVWKRPEYSDIDTLASFLNSLNWPTVKQHLLLFNEINHAQEWGGGVDIKNFTDIAIYTAKKFKSLNSNFVILSSPLDLASPEKPPEFKSAEAVFREIHLYQPEYFQLIDGLASHSYPNHGFIGKPTNSGRFSIKGYEWELNLLKNLGVAKSYPVFITETGWPHREGETKNNNFYTVQTAANFLESALKIWSKDNRIIAATPFIYNYPYSPFDHFSWVDKKEKLYPEYQKIVNLPKSQNTPSQITQFQFQKIHLPFLILTGNEYFGQISLKNTGQSIWGEKQFCLNPQASTNVILEAICLANKYIYPGESHLFNFKFQVNQNNTNLKTYLSWDNLPRTEIVPFYGGASIYHRKSSLLQTLRDLFNNYLRLTE